MAELLSASESFYTQFEPKVQNRYILYCDGIPSFLVKKCPRPKWKQDAKQIDYINQRWFYKGKTIWESIQLELYDPVVPSGAQAVMEWQRLHHESVTGRNGYMDFYKKDLVIDVLGPPNDVVEEWLLKGCFITAGDFGEASWENEGDPMSISLTVQPDYCILQF